MFTISNSNYFLKISILICTFKRLTMDLRTSNIHILTPKQMSTRLLTTSFNILEFIFEKIAAKRVNSAYLPYIYKINL